MKVFLIILSFGILISCCYGEEVSAIKLVYQDTENYPFETGSGSEMPEDKPGISVEMLILVSKILKIPFTFTRRPWKRCLVELESNYFDGLFQASYRAERLKYGVYPYKNGVVNPDKRSHTNSYCLFVLKNTNIQWDGNTLKRVDGLIGVPLGYSVVDDLKRMGLNLHEEKSTFQNMRLLKEGYLSAVVDFDLAGDSYIKKYPYLFSDIMKIKPALSVKHYYLMLSHGFVRKNPQLSFRIWDTIEKIRNSGQYRKIVSAY